MTLLPVAVVVLMSASGYVRTRTDSTDANSPFLFWKQNTITYIQDSMGNPDTTGDTEFTAVTTSFNTWNDQFQACGGLTLVEGPRTSHRRAVFAEPSGGQKNVVLFRHDRCSTKVPATDKCWSDGNCYNVHDCWGYRNETIALTTTTFNAETGQVLDADIELNAALFEFTTVNTFSCSFSNQSQNCIATDIQNTMTHEIGHLLGLDHSPSSGSTMHASAPIGETQKRNLDSDSQSFVCEVYPEGTTLTVQKLDPEVGVGLGCSSITGTLFPFGLMAWIAVDHRRRHRRALRP